MDNQEKRKNLAKWILETDENILNEVEAVYNVYSKNTEKPSEIVAYTVNGEPLNKEMYVQKINEAEKRVDQGQFTTHEDLLKEMQSW